MKKRFSAHGFANGPAKTEGWVSAGVPSVPRASDGGRVSTPLAVDITPARRGRIEIAAFRRDIAVADLLRDLFPRQFPPADGETP